MREDSPFSSLHRLAQTGELVVTHRFATGAIGFAPAGEVDALDANPVKVDEGLWALMGRLFPKRATPAEGVTIIWIPPGSRLRVSQLPDESAQTALFTPLEEMTFLELDAAEHRYRDALRLRSGGILPLQCVEEGVCFQIISTESKEPAAYGPRVEFNEWLR
jgi:hypothetical protein